MTYVRPRNAQSLKAEAKAELLKQYGDFYKTLVTRDPGELNKKLPREALAASIGRIGALIIEESQAIVADNAEVRQFLDENKLPAMMIPLLPDDFRVFSLLLNALKQWLGAEQAATDKYLLGSNARTSCRKMMATCLVTGEPLTGKIALHHPVRDGRPPIPLSEAGHQKIEKQTGSGEPAEDDDIARVIGEIRKQGQSWAMLRRGCRIVLGLPPDGGSKNSNASAKSMARRAMAKTERTAQDLLDWMDEKDLGSSSKG